MLKDGRHARLPMKICRFALMLSAALVLTQDVRSTTVIPPTFEELADRAELVFVGQVIGSHAEWRAADARRAIFTFTEFRVDEVWKGNADKTITLQFLGGTIGDDTLEVAGVPRFSQNERVVLFVTKNGIQFCPLVGIYHGKFGLRKDGATGREIVVKHDGKPLRDVAEIGAGDGAQFAAGRLKKDVDAGQAPISIDTFKVRVRDHLSKSGLQK
jgi:hypothetical protein